MTHYVYRIEEPATGRYYIGQRCVSRHENPTTWKYSGSGLWLIRYRRKHSDWKNRLIKRVLVLCEAGEANRIEAALVDQKRLQDPLCMNMKEGGKSAPHSEHAIAKLRASRIGKRASPETRAKISAAKKGHKHTKHTPEAIAKMSASKKGRRFSPEHLAALSAAQQARHKKRRENEDTEV
jgi:hypothetical protein